MIISSSQQRWQLKRTFTISRDSRTYTDVLYVRIQHMACEGIAECAPNSRDGETIESVNDQINQATIYFEAFANSNKESTKLAKVEKTNYCDVYQALRYRLLIDMPAGAARNALDCALWDLQTKVTNTSVARLLSLSAKKEIISAQTIGIGSKNETIARAREYSQYPILKVKLGATHVLDTLATIHACAPDAKMIIDANEAWSYSFLCDILPQLQHFPIILIEQPLKAQDDDKLEALTSPIPLCADESFRTHKDLAKLSLRYDCVNIKLDKAGGLTEALRIVKRARENQLGVMIGCMVGTSLSISPAYLVAHLADFVDLDGPTLLKQDYPWGFSFRRGVMHSNILNNWGQ